MSSKNNRKNPVAGNQNNAPMQDPTSGQVLDNTDNKGGATGDVEHIPGSDTILEPGPASDPVEGNSNVNKDQRSTVTAEPKEFPDVVGEPNQASDQDSGSESGKSSDDSAADESDGGKASEAPAESKDDSSETLETSGPSEAVDAPLPEASLTGDAGAVQDDGLQSSEGTQAQESSGEQGAAPEDKAEPAAVAPEAAEPESGEKVTVGEAEAKKLTEEDLRALYSRILPEDALKGWDFATLFLYHESRVQPAKTRRGNWPVDIRRQRTLTDWSSDELLDWVDGSIKTPKGVDEQALEEELYKRFRMPGNWTVEAAKHYALTGERPEYTSQGVLKDDATRKAKSIHHWQYKELRSALLKEIDTDFTEEELLEQLRQRLGLTQSFSAARLLDSLPEMPSEANVDNMLLKSKLEEYKNIMSKNGSNLTEATAATAQVILYKAIRLVMQRDTQSFYEGWNILLDFINENYNTLFISDKARRGWAQMKVSKSASSTFEDLLTLLIHTRRPAGRVQEAKLYDLNHILRYVTSEEERNNVVIYYSPAQ